MRQIISYLMNSKISGPLLRTVASFSVGLLARFVDLKSRYPGTFNTMKLLGIGAACALLLAMLISCGRPSMAITEVRRITPPAALLIPTPEPVPNGETNHDIFIWALELLEALRSSNADKTAINKWVAP